MYLRCSLSEYLEVKSTLPTNYVIFLNGYYKATQVFFHMFDLFDDIKDMSIMNNTLYFRYIDDDSDGWAYHIKLKMKLR